MWLGFFWEQLQVRLCWLGLEAANCGMRLHVHPHNMLLSTLDPYPNH